MPDHPANKAPTMTPQAFVAKWKRASLPERSAYQQHFLDLCDLFGQEKPADADPDGAWYTFERGTQKTDGGKGWADVWKRGWFAWEYKRKDKYKDLQEAYRQLRQYREDLENPPLLIVSDFTHNEIHTNFTGTPKQVYRVDLEEITQPERLDVLRKVFTNPASLNPGLTTEDVTEEVAGRFAQLADGLRRRNIPMQQAAHFLMKVMFCMFAEDIDLLPEGLFTRILTSCRGKPGRLASKLRELFEKMAKGGDFGADTILYFNGGLFADADVVELTPEEIGELIEVNKCDWSSIEPSIFGTLLERTIDPDKRAQVGLHYTSKKDIETLLEPVLMAPLRQEWREVKGCCEKVWVGIQEGVKGRTWSNRRKDCKERREFDRLLLDFVQRLSEANVLDPACGSGNFLYVAINQLLALEKEVIAYAASHGTPVLPHVSPTQLAGMERNEYAQELAQVVIWIGHLQWKQQNGFDPPRDPVLAPVESIRHLDAILDLSDPDNPREPEWAEAEFIVGNPPFLGGKLLRTHLGDTYVDGLFRVWGERVRPEADVCCYWFEKARAMIEAGKTRRAGLLATQGIRGGASRETLARIKQTGDIFFAVSDRDWILDGANVHISMVGFDDGTEARRTLDGRAVTTINPNLTATADITQARRLSANLNLSFMGDTKGGPFDIPFPKALELLHTPNVGGKPSSDAVLPWCNGLDVTRRNRDMWIIDFGVGRSEAEASRFDSVFQYLKSHAEKARGESRSAIKQWWLHERPRVDMRNTLKPLDRFLVTPAVAKHRLFVWMASPTLPDHQLIVIARSDDYFLGVLHSRPHEVWGLRLGTRLETRPRYTPTTCFETFPFPQPTDGQRTVIAEAAQELDRLRSNWLNPAEWIREEVLEFPGSADGPWGHYIQNADLRGVGTVRFPRLVPKNEDCARKLAERTLTNLYNQRPAWLVNAHRELDEAVFAAYNWKPTVTDEEILDGLLELNLEAAAKQALMSDVDAVPTT
jgi:hypothetical protein